MSRPIILPAFMLSIFEGRLDLSQPLECAAYLGYRDGVILRDTGQPIGDLIAGLDGEILKIDFMASSCELINPYSTIKPDALVICTGEDPVAYFEIPTLREGESVKVEFHGLATEEAYEAEVDRLVGELAGIFSRYRRRYTLWERFLIWLDRRL